MTNFTLCHNVLKSRLLQMHPQNASTSGMLINPFHHTDISLDTSTAEGYWKHCGKRRNCSLLYFHLLEVSRIFAKMFSKSSAANNEIGCMWEKVMLALKLQLLRNFLFFAVKCCLLQMRQNVSAAVKGFKRVIVREYQTVKPYFKIFSYLQTHFDAIAADIFWKHCSQMWNCSWWAISSLATMFSTLFNN